MEFLCVLKEVKGISTFTSKTSGKEVKVADVVLKAGNDEIIASAFEEVASAIESGEVKPGVLYRVNVLFQVQAGQNRCFQSCSLPQICKVYDGSAF